MGLDAAWRRRPEILKLWLDNGGDLKIASYAGETIVEAVDLWIEEAANSEEINPPQQDLVERVRKGS